MKSKNKSDFILQGQGIEQMFDLMDGHLFWVKNVSGKFEYGNTNLLKIHNKKSLKDLIGLTDFDLHPMYLAKRYVNNDSWVAQNNESVRNRIELRRESEGSLEWYSTTKIPLVSSEGKVLGTAGMSEKIQSGARKSHLAFSLSKAIKFIDDNLDKVISIQDLASLVDLSISQFERRFRKFFGVPPVKYIMTTKIEKACDLLTLGDSSIMDIGLEVGFYDNSHFTRRFREQLGITPREYRENFK